MYTQDGKFFTGHRFSSVKEVTKAGQIDKITLRVRAWDNDGRKFESPPIVLSPSQQAKSLSGIKGQQEVIDELIRELYEASVAPVEVEPPPPPDPPPATEPSTETEDDESTEDGDDEDPSFN